MNQKRILSVLLAALLCFGFTACKDQKENQEGSFSADTLPIPTGSGTLDIEQFTMAEELIELPEIDDALPEPITIKNKYNYNIDTTADQTVAPNERRVYRVLYPELIGVENSSAAKINEEIAALFRDVMNRNSDLYQNNRVIRYDYEAYEAWGFTGLIVHCVYGADESSALFDQSYLFTYQKATGGMYNSKNYMMYTSLHEEDVLSAVQAELKRLNGEGAVKYEIPKTLTDEKIFVTDDNQVYIQVKATNENSAGISRVVKVSVS